MRSRIVIIALFCLNLVQLGGLIWLWQSHSSASTLPPASSPTRRAIQLEPITGTTTNATFHWQQVESSDYKTYIANLRRIGCPEETIRDLVVADVNKLFASRRRTLLQPTEWKYWEPGGRDSASAVAKQRAKLDALDQERRRVLAELLGPGVLEELARVTDDLFEERLAFLSPELRSRVLAILGRFRDQRQALYLEAEQNGTPLDSRKLKVFRDERESALAAMLSPEDLSSYQLRNSETADQLRWRLVGFGPSEAEFRELFELHKQHDDRFALVDASDTASMEKELEDRRKMEDEIKSLLGEARYTDYQRTANVRYQELYQMTQEFDLPTTAAATVFDRHRQMLDEIRRRQDDSSLSAEARQAALERDQAEMDALLRQTLGEKAYARFQLRGIDHWFGE